MHAVHVNNLRISITQRCNMRCIYCHHEGESGSNGDEISAAKFEQSLRIARDLGIKKLKITGGEPLMRRDVVALVGMASGYMNDVSMTTNGSLLPLYASALRDAGLKRVNISLDSLRGDRYRAITLGRLDMVMGGIRSAIEAGIRPIKLNTVMLRGVNDDEVWNLAEFARGNNCVLQLIELEAGRDQESTDFYRRYHYDLRDLENDLERRAERTEIRSMHHRRKYFVDGAEIEIVRPMHNSEFCANCTRLRMTSAGRLKPCLLNSEELDVPENEQEARNVFVKAVESKKPYWDEEK